MSHLSMQFADFGYQNKTKKSDRKVKILTMVLCLEMSGSECLMPATLHTSMIILCCLFLGFFYSWASKPMTNPSLSLVSGSHGVLTPVWESNDQSQLF